MISWLATVLVLFLVWYGWDVSYRTHGHSFCSPSLVVPGAVYNFAFVSDLAGSDGSRRRVLAAVRADPSGRPR